MTAIEFSAHPQCYAAICPVDPTCFCIWLVINGASLLLKWRDFASECEDGIDFYRLYKPKFEYCGI